MDEKRPYVILSPFPKNAHENWQVDDIAFLTPKEAAGVPAECLTPAIDADVNRAVVAKAQAILNVARAEAKATAESVQAAEADRKAYLERADARIRELKFQAGLSKDALDRAEADFRGKLEALGLPFPSGGEAQPAATGATA